MLTAIFFALQASLINKQPVKVFGAVNDVNVMLSCEIILSSFVWSEMMVPFNKVDFSVESHSIVGDQ